MSTGYSLHIGLNRADVAHYGDMPELKAAVNDALFWESFATGLGYTTSKLHDEYATSEAVKHALNAYATQMVAGDILLLTYAGHGGELANDKPAGFDNEQNDQTWCLYDRQLLDDELYEAFEKFSEGTRILIVSDSCHAGTITRDGELDLSKILANGMERAAMTGGARSRKLDTNVKKRIYVKFGESVYKPIQKKYQTKAQGSQVKASVKLLAACQDDETTLDGENNGIFTEAFIEIFKDPAYKDANCEMLIAAVQQRYFMPRPNFFQYGGIIPAFDHHFPFTINIPDADQVKGFRKPRLQKKDGARFSFEREAPWDMLTLKKPAVLAIDLPVALAGDYFPGKDAVVLSNVVKGSRQVTTLEFPGIPNEHAWSVVHAIQTELDRLGHDAIVEPVLSLAPAQNGAVSREGDINNPDYIKEWPPSLNQGEPDARMGWHLDEKHSQLAKAHAFVQTHRPGAHIRVGHLDTGFIEGHVARPLNLNTTLARSFVSGEDPNQAIDKSASGQDGHGLGTMTLLAGNNVTKSATFNEFEGYVGGIPFAEVVPIRISESVVIMNSENFCNALEYAVEIGCEVVTMSMAGKPSKKMARAVNDAYDAGLVIVSAASNCWYKGAGALLPKCVMFPAAYERVIAATGAMYDHQPYDVNFIQQARFNIGTKYMQGSWGPASRMTRALAAYTPNTPWASTAIPFLRSGGGTSSATPQVASAAALWIAYHRDELEQKGYYKPGHQWKKVEAVRNALYTAAAKGETFTEWQKYYGNGILRAFDALLVGVPDAADLQPSPEAESSLFGIGETIGAFFKNRKLFRSEAVKPSVEALTAELVDLLQTDPEFYRLYSVINLTDPISCAVHINNDEFKSKVMKSPYASPYLKQAMID